VLTGLALKSPVTPERGPHNVEKVADRRGARCAVASNAVETLWKRCEKRLPFLKIIGISIIINANITVI